LSPSSDILIGKLPNGLKYYIRENKKPEKRMELRLAVNAGSVLEDNDQQGLAHFVEHMLFNGTKSFPKMDIVNFLERTGVRFGPHLNAYTSFDETVYMIQVPTDSPAVVQKSFQILEEWSHAALFDSIEIDKERGVVGEEWRLGRGAFERVGNKHYPFIFYNSQYGKRLPIGKKEVIDTASYDALKRFYHDWYRPDLMAVVAVGDFNKHEIEKMITDHFSSLKNPNNERTRSEFTIPNHTEPLISIATDKELPTSSISIYFKRNDDQDILVKDYKKHILNGLYDAMLNTRLQERLQKPNPPFIFGNVGNFRFVGDKQAFGLFATVKETDILRGMEALVTEAFRVKQHGFTQSELERQKTQSLRMMEEAFKERDKTESRNYAGEYIRNFLQGESIPGIETEFNLYKQLLPTISLADVNELTKERIVDSNRVVTVSIPEKEGVVAPSKEEILRVFSDVSSRKLDPYIDSVSSKPLLATQPKPGKIVSEKEIKELGAWEWKLSNGVRVIVKPTDFKNDEILFGAYSPGGNSLVANKDYISGSFASQLASLSGVAEFDAITLQKMLTGKVVRVSPMISELSEGFAGNSTPQDLETLFQLVYLEFTSPRVDSNAVGAFLSRIKSYLQNMKVMPEQAFQDTIQVTLAQYHYRARPQSPAMIDEINIGKSFSIYKDRFADASDFTFFFVGSFKIDSLKPLVEKYLASLPSLNRKESWKDVGIKMPQGKISKEVFKGVEPKSSVVLVFNGPFEWNIQNRFDFNAMLEVLRIRLREVLREDKGGVYGVGISGNPSLYPRKEYSIRIGFGCNPERVEELVNAVMQQIDTLKLKPADQTNIDKVKELQRREREVNLKENNWWLSVFRSSYANGEDPLTILKTPERIDKLNTKAVQDAAKKYFTDKNIVKIVLKPETTKK
ncbi:MAG: insulinase family protein, partial [Bacteroidota bacterium]|nr:insulinase family protein [Bacteroidota bacterium]